MHRRWPGVAAGVAGLIVLVALYLLIPDVRSALQLAMEVMSGANIERIRDYLLGFGVWAPIISAVLMVFQALVLPLPSMALTLANGLLLGTLWGALLSWTSGMLAAMVCYGLSRLYGRPLVTRLVGEPALARTDAFFQRHGRRAVLLARLIPFISFDVVSYAAGLGSISPIEFAIATGLGQLPATLLYSWLGETSPRLANAGLWIVLAIALIVAVGLFLRQRFEQRQTDD
jgi:uncharacterized membrane protein YdjX (TVP38/TMEM64 family)